MLFMLNLSLYFKKNIEKNPKAFATTKIAKHIPCG